jgi:C-terminal processing protease CtpA/Prc
MNRNQHGFRALRRAGHAAILAAAVLPGLAAAADASAAQEERRQREVEDSQRLQREIARDQAMARREMEQRERVQRQALRGQEDIIARQDERLEEMRRRLEEASSEYARAASDLGRNFNYSFGTVIGAPPRALLGISVDTSERRDGALVSLVSPGGAAEEVGIRAGDLITSIDGHDLTNDSQGGRTLVNRLQLVRPDTKVKLGVLRDGRKMNFEVTTRAAPSPSSVAQAELDVLRQRYNNNHPEVISRMEALRGEPGRTQTFELFSSASPLGGMEFATISKRLGNYFGVDGGVLVVRAGAESPYGLQDGDVILSIDGRVPENAQHVGRILRSYQPGEKVKLRVQRDRKAIDLESSAPGARAAGGR